MIDIHCHILPGLDDGPETFEESIKMCQIAMSDGIEKIVAAPHVRRNTYNNISDNITTQTDALNALLPMEGILLKVIPAADVRFEWDLLEQVMSGRMLMLGSNVQYLLLELPSELIPPNFTQVAHKLLLKGIVPIIPHPERNYDVQNNLRRLYDLVNLGVLVQVATMSLTGEFGVKVERTAKLILKHRLAHLIATEAHSIAQKIIGNNEAEAMVTKNPQRILKGELVEPVEPIMPKRKWFFRWLGFAEK